MLALPAWAKKGWPEPWTALNRVAASINLSQGCHSLKRNPGGITMLVLSRGVGERIQIGDELTKLSVNLFLFDLGQIILDKLKR